MSIIIYRSASSTGDARRTAKGRIVVGQRKPDLAITFGSGTYRRSTDWEVLVGYRDFKSLAKAMMEASPKSAKAAFSAALASATQP